MADISVQNRAPRLVFGPVIEGVSDSGKTAGRFPPGVSVHREEYIKAIYEHPKHGKLFRRQLQIMQPGQSQDAVPVERFNGRRRADPPASLEALDSTTAIQLIHTYRDDPSTLSMWAATESRPEVLQAIRLSAGG